MVAPACCSLEAHDFDSAIKRLKEHEVLQEESHYSVRILICPDCGARFLSVFTEEIDWNEGNDPMRAQILRLNPDMETRIRALSPDYESERLNSLNLAGESWLMDWPSDRERRLDKGLMRLFVYPHD